MNILVCVKRVPAPGTRIHLSEDGQEMDTRNLGFAISPHEECAVEEAIQLKEKYGGKVTVLTVGPNEAGQQLRRAMAMGADEGILLQTDGEDWNPMATADAITDAIRDIGFDLLLFGNESADSGGYQVGIRVAYSLNLPCISGAKSIDILNGNVSVKREASAGWEIFETALPAVISVKEGINLPRHPSLPGRMRANRNPMDQRKPEPTAGGPEKIRLRIPEEQGTKVQILGKGSEAVSKILEILKELGLLK